MNCESVNRLLDHTDLNAVSNSERRAVQSHVESCPDCAAVLDAHDQLSAMRIPSVPADLEECCLERVASAPDRGADRRRAGPFVLGSLVVAAAAAFISPMWFSADDEVVVAGGSERRDSTFVQGAAVSGTGSSDSASDSFIGGDGDVAATSAAVASTSTETFTVELTRLVPVDQTQLGSLFGDWFQAALVEELRRVPNLVLIEAAGPIEVSSIPIVDPSERSFSFDRDTTTWPGEFDIRLAAGAGAGDDWVGTRWTAVSADGNVTGGSSDSRSMRPSVEAGPEYATVLAAEVIERLRVELFPADASSLASQFARYEAILADPSADIPQRSNALDAAWQLARRANDPNITARIVDGTLAYAEQFEEAMLNSDLFARVASRTPANEMEAVRAQVADMPAGLLSSLVGRGDARVIGPMSEALLYDQSAEVRRVAASILGEFVDDAVARSALESAAAFDASAEVRETAGNYLLDDAAHVENIFAGLRDSSLSDLERLESILYSDRLQFVEQGFTVDSDTVDAVADLIERSDAGTRRDALLGLSWYQSPSFVPVYLERLRNDPSPDVRGELIGILSDFRSLPDVDIALEAAAADDPADNVRAAAARILTGADGGD